MSQPRAEEQQARMGQLGIASSSVRWIRQILPEQVADLCIAAQHRGVLV
jgi:hypothetical protein